ncbi:hypothetical protein GGI24_002058 [Coemansia furcata]|nr:hypothetical protein GGI24_002058 [Coemansia furcata]
MTTLEQVTLARGSVTTTFDVAVTHGSVVLDLVHTFSSNSTEHFSAIELHAAFIQHCVDCGSSDAALSVFDAFCQTYGTDTSDIHVIVQAQGLDKLAARRVLRGYYSVWSLVNSRSARVSSSPALFSSDSVGLMAMFGGQRGFGNSINEAIWLFDVYRPLLSDFVSHMSTFMHGESQGEHMLRMYPKGFDIFTWLTLPATMPDERYLLSMPVVLPLVALIQMMHIMVLCKTLGISPSELVKRFKGQLQHGTRN